MILRRSQYVHLIPLGNGRELAVHAVSGTRLTLAAEAAALIRYFDQPRELAQAVLELPRGLGCPPEAITAGAAGLIERKILSRVSAEEEALEVRRSLTETRGRDPVELLERYRRRHAAGVSEYWTVAAPQTCNDLAPGRPTFRIAVLGECDVQMEADFLRAEGARRGLDLRVAAAFLDDLRLLAELEHHAVIVGMLPGRHTIALGTAADHGGDPAAFLIAEARDAITRIRAATAAPVLLNSLPVPTVEPLGLGGRGEDSHRNRFRRANLQLEELAREFPDVYVADIDAAMSAAGKGALLDDSLVGFTHFGFLGWMLQRPASEQSAVHGIFPDVAPLAEQAGGHPYGGETVMARAHMDLLTSILGIDRKKCVIVDLDGTLWPGVLAETGSPFAWSPEISGPYSFIGLYFGVHEALKALLRRGILLACVSKNDEATVRDLWRYGDHYPLDRLIHLEDFVTHRINWQDKVTNIRSIADELGFTLDSFVFVDDNPVERERVSQALPEVVVLGDNPFELRRRLLTDPRLQSPIVTSESGDRTKLVAAQLRRAELRRSASDEEAFRDSLQLECDVRRVSLGDGLERIRELFDRTTQFNTTGRKFTALELTSILENANNYVFTMRFRDRFGDHGMVGACVVEAFEITAFAMSCRALGLGIEQRFLTSVLERLAAEGRPVTARIIPTSRNLPAANIYRDHRFTDEGAGRWRLSPCVKSPADMPQRHPAPPEP